MRVFIQSIIAQLLLNPYLFWRGYQAIPAKKSWRIPYILFFVIEIGTFLFGYTFRNELPDQWMIGIEYFCNTWYIASLYIAMSLFVIEALRLTNRWWRWFPPLATNNWKQTKLSCFFIILLGVTALMINAYHRVDNPIVKHINVTLDKKAADGRDSLTIVMMSDLHIGEMIGKRLVQKYVALSNAQNPDLVVLVGDIIDYESRFAEQAHIEDDLQQLQAPLGVYITYGNHEYRANIHAKHRWLEKTGATLLVDSVIMPDSSFYLIGRDDYINKKRHPLNALLKGVDKSKPLIVLDHQPWSFAEMEMNGIDLGLHGHTHNGQFWPYPLVLKFIYECAYGYYRNGPTQFYVSSGIGCAGPPYRVGTVSELVVLHVKFAK